MHSKHILRFLSYASILALLVAACGAKASATAPPGTTPLAVESATATLAQIVGTTQLKHVGGDWTEASFGAWLSVTDQLRTGEDSLAAITIGAVGSVRFGPNSVVTLETLSGTPQDFTAKLKLDSGTAFIILSGALQTGSLTVETPLGTGLVTGSLLGLEISPEGFLIVTCLETASP